MAEVTFIGGGNTGFPSSDVQILPYNAPFIAESQIVGSAPAPGEVSTLVELFTPTMLQEPQVEFYEIPAFVPFSLNPNENDLIYVVVGGMTNGQLVNVQLRKALAIQGEDIAEQGLITDQLTLFPGVLGPSGLLGKQVVFLQPTGISYPSPIVGATGTIAQVFEAPTGKAKSGSDVPAITPTVIADNGVGLSFENPIAYQPTNGDRFIVVGDSRILRRTPLIEVILE